MTSMMEHPEPVEIFYSYAHEDEKWRVLLEKWLVSLRREGTISVWHDRKITAGKEWSGEINIHLEKAQIILLLISQDFINSDYINDVEMDVALKRHETGQARVIPIMLRPIFPALKNTRFSKLQALPREGKPVTEWPTPGRNYDKPFQNIAEGISEAVNELFSRQAQQKTSNTIKLLDILIRHNRTVKVEKLKQESQLSDDDFNKADMVLLHHGHVRQGPTTRIITEEGRVFWRAHQHHV